MANFDYNQQNFWNAPPASQFPQQPQDFNFEMPDQFGQELNFQNFNPPPVDQQQQQHQQQHQGGPLNQNQNFEMQYASNNSFLDPMQPYGHSEIGQQKSYIGNEFEDEPPLLEELGINPSHILQKTLSVLNPFRTPNRDIFEDTDLAGPLVFCLAFGCFLLLSGKVTFSYIYGIGVLGCISCYCLLSLMSKNAVTFGNVVSVLGYCLLPMVCLSGLNVVITIQGMVGTILTGFAILWCAVSASKLFVTALSMDHQQLLVAYPCALLYGVFALITIF